MKLGKRALDLLGASLGLLLLSPLFLAISTLVRLSGGGGVFFRQERIGYGGEPYRMWKFRTMIPDAERQGPQLTVGGDPRITPVGHWLRRYKLDELPQLINVLAGEMSLVGPRPEVKRYVELYAPEERRVLGLVPGITDPASIAYRNESEILARAEDPEALYVSEIMPAKIRTNLAYASRSTVWSDIGVIVRTIIPARGDAATPSPPAPAASTARAENWFGLPRRASGELAIEDPREAVDSRVEPA
jgi:lipopolysaccharide/colanic/teichoic acid biosynthesis glycosyltransferase